MNELCDEIDCEDNLKYYIDGNIDSNIYKPVINPDLEGEQKDVPKDNITETEIDRIKTKQLDKLGEDDVKGKEEIEEIPNNKISLIYYRVYDILFKNIENRIYHEQITNTYHTLP